MVSPVCRNQRKKKALAETKDAYNQLLADNQALLQHLEAANSEHYHVSEHFRQEVLAKNLKIADLQNQLEQVSTVCLRANAHHVAAVHWY